MRSKNQVERKSNYSPLLALNEVLYLHKKANLRIAELIFNRSRKSSAIVQLVGAKRTMQTLRQDLFTFLARIIAKLVGAKRAILEQKKSPFKGFSLFLIIYINNVTYIKNLKAFDFNAFSYVDLKKSDYIFAEIFERGWLIGLDTK